MVPLCSKGALMAQPLSLGRCNCTTHQWKVWTDGRDLSLFLEGYLVPFLLSCSFLVTLE